MPQELCPSKANVDVLVEQFRCDESQVRQALVAANGVLEDAALTLYMRCLYHQVRHTHWMQN